MALPTGEEIGLLLRDWRKAERLSQEELAASAGVNQRTISYMERGQSITFENLWRLLDYFGKDVSALSREVSRNAPESPKSDPGAGDGWISLSEHRAVVRAFLAQIATLEQASAKPGAIRPETIDQLGEKADEEDEGDDSTPPSSGHGKAGSGRRNPRQRGGSGRKP